MRDTKMVIRADAKAMGAITAHTPRGAERWLASKPADRTFGGTPFTGTSECISYMPGQAPKIFAPARQSIHKKQRAHVVAIAPHRINAADLAPIGNVE